MKRVVIGLSGGVDSSVAAYLLQKEGYEVIGLYMINWHDTEGTLSGDCPWKDDLIIAELVAKKLGIEFHSVDFSEQYRKRVVDYMFDEYGKGRTPNPDVLCNREIKFDVFLEHALSFNADYVATGHYCKKEIIHTDQGEEYKLMAGDDGNKDQSYFLCQLSQSQLEKVLFPIGHLNKPEIRAIASKANLPTADKKDSQGICFVGKVDLPTFLQQQLEAKEGKVIEIAANSKHLTGFSELDPGVGKDNFKLAAIKPNFSSIPGKFKGLHKGAHFYTVGQRKGLNIGGTPLPLFVLAVDTVKNVVYVGQGDDHPGLNFHGLFIDQKDIHWVRSSQKLNIGEVKEYDIRIRYRQPLQKAKILATEEGHYVLFENKQRGITPGQFAAWYQNGELQGSGAINY